MGQPPDDFDQFWQRTLDTLAGYPACPEIDAIPLRSTGFATLYGVRLTSLGPYRLFGYLSVPAGDGLCAVQPDRGHGQAAVRLRGPRPRRRTIQARRRRRPVLRAASVAGTVNA